MSVEEFYVFYLPHAIPFAYFFGFSQDLARLEGYLRVMASFFSLGLRFPSKSHDL